jgi:hypothetical protein
MSCGVDAASEEFEDLCFDYGIELDDVVSFTGSLDCSFFLRHSCALTNQLHGLARKPLKESLIEVYVHPHADIREGDASERAGKSRGL